MNNEVKQTDTQLSNVHDEEESKKDKIVYSNEVISTIAGMAINDVDGLAGVCTPNGAAINRSKSAGKGIKVSIAAGEVSVEVCVIAQYGASIQKAAVDLQDSVRKAIESMTGLHVIKVDVRIQNISFTAENNPSALGPSKKTLEVSGMKKTPALDSGKMVGSEKTGDKNKPEKGNKKENNRIKADDKRLIDDHEERIATEKTP